MDEPRRLVVGLGNPGARYRGTRHNVGFRVLDFLARREGLFFEPSTQLDGFSGAADFSWARSFDPDGMLVKPLTFMNASGDAVGPLLEWAGLGPRDLLVVYDDMDLEVGVLRVRPKGGDGGQRGMASIIETLRTDRFARLRVGIGRSGTDAARHVLSEFTPSERERIDQAVAEAADAVFSWLTDGNVERVMTRFHSRWKSSAESASESRAPSAPTKQDE
ncbi:MAG TPA: aminoacyl-tRNA hydrolase [Planctomycetes bacterium]|nr:aminoacyl-tRNA hydrolase [Planctomycetota bacterium]